MHGCEEEGGKEVLVNVSALLDARRKVKGAFTECSMALSALDKVLDKQLKIVHSQRV